MRNFMEESSKNGGVWGLLLAAGWLLLGWPLVTVAGDGLWLFAYLFISAGGIVALLWALSRRLGGRGPKE